MFSKVFDKILGLSDSYNFYKTEYSRLNEKCELLEKDNASLKEDIKKILDNLNSKQDELIENCNFKELSEDNEKILDALMNNQYHFSKKFDENRKILESVEDSCMRVEKTSSYTHIKLDSKFDDNKRFMDEILSRLE